MDTLARSQWNAVDRSQIEMFRVKNRDRFSERAEVDMERRR